MVREVVHDVLFLGQKSEPATQADKQVAIDLLDTLKAHEEGCVGMAANMIGVRNPIKETFDIHDRVNYAAVASSLQVNVEKKVILLEIELDEEICSILDYFEIFLQRMLMCKRAAEILGLKFKMKANGNKIC